MVMMMMNAFLRLFLLLGLLPTSKAFSPSSSSHHRRFTPEKAEIAEMGAKDTLLEPVKFEEKTSAKDQSTAHQKRNMTDEAISDAVHQFVHDVVDNNSLAKSPPSTLFPPAAAVEQEDGVVSEMTPQEDDANIPTASHEPSSSLTESSTKDGPLSAASEPQDNDSCDKDLQQTISAVVNHQARMEMKAAASRDIDWLLTLELLDKELDRTGRAVQNVEIDEDFPFYANLRVSPTKN